MKAPLFVIFLAVLVAGQAVQAQDGFIVAQVSDAQGPVPNASVQAKLSAQDWVFPLPYFAITNVSGTANLTVPAGEYDLIVLGIPDTHTVSNASAALNVTVLSNQTRIVNLTLFPYRSIQVLVADTDGVTPINGSLVRAVASGRGLASVVATNLTNSSGVALLRLPHGEFDIFAEPPRTGSGFIQSNESALLRVFVNETVPASLGLQLQRTAIATILVESPLSTRASNVTVEVTRATDTFSNSTGNITDPSGASVFELPPGAYDLRAQGINGSFEELPTSTLTNLTLFQPTERTLFTDNFDSYAPGPLAGQGGWAVVGPNPVNVVSPGYSAPQAVRCVGPGTCSVYNDQVQDGSVAEETLSFNFNWTGPAGTAGAVTQTILHLAGLSTTHSNEAGGAFPQAAFAIIQDGVLTLLVSNSTSSFTSTGFHPVEGTWYQVRITINQTYAVLRLYTADGFTLLASAAAPASDVRPPLLFVNILPHDIFNGFTVDFDNVRVTAPGGITAPAGVTNVTLLLKPWGVGPVNFTNATTGDNPVSLYGNTAAWRNGYYDLSTRQAKAHNLQQAEVTRPSVWKNLIAAGKDQIRWFDIATQANFNHSLGQPGFVTSLWEDLALYSPTSNDSGPVNPAVSLKVFNLTTRAATDTGITGTTGAPVLFGNTIAFQKSGTLQLYNRSNGAQTDTGLRAVSNFLGNSRTLGDKTLGFTVDEVAAGVDYDGDGTLRSSVAGVYNITTMGSTFLGPGVVQGVHKGLVLFNNLLQEHVLFADNFDSYTPGFLGGQGSWQAIGPNPVNVVSPGYNSPRAIRCAGPGTCSVYNSNVQDGSVTEETLSFNFNWTGPGGSTSAVTQHILHLAGLSTTHSDSAGGAFPQAAFAIIQDGVLTLLASNGTVTFASTGYNLTEGTWYRVRISINQTDLLLQLSTADGATLLATARAPSSGIVPPLAFVNLIPHDIYNAFTVDFDNVRVVQQVFNPTSELKLYDTRTGLNYSAGVPGPYGALYGDTVAFVTPEANWRQDLDGNGTVGDFVLALNLFRDTDGDGVSDINDRCPDTPKVVPVDVEGCPVRTGDLLESFSALQVPGAVVRVQDASGDDLLSRGENFTVTIDLAAGQGLVLSNVSGYTAFDTSIPPPTFQVFSAADINGTSAEQQVKNSSGLGFLQAVSVLNFSSTQLSGFLSTSTYQMSARAFTNLTGPAGNESLAPGAVLAYCPADYSASSGCPVNLTLITTRCLDNASTLCYKALEVHPEPDLDLVEIDNIPHFSALISIVGSTTPPPPPIPKVTDLAASPLFAPVGLVNLTFSVSGLLAANPVVTVNGNPAGFLSCSGNCPASPTAGSAFYTYVYAVSASDAEGPATVVVAGQDTAANPVSAREYGLFTIDHTAPVVAILSPTNGTIFFTAATFLPADDIPISFQASDAVSGVASLSGTLDSQSVASGTTVSAGTLSVGNHTLAVAAADRAGNNASASVRFQVRTPLAATVEIDPSSLNSKSQGNFVTAYIELPAGFSVANIDVSTVRLDGAVPARASPTQIGDQNHNGVPDLMVKFDRQAVSALVAPPSATLTVNGRLFDRTPFTGNAVVRVK